MTKRPRGTGTIYRQPSSTIWWIKYPIGGGRSVRESSKSEKRRDAEDLLKQRLGEAVTGTGLNPHDRKVLMDDLYAGLLNYYRQQKRKSLDGTQQRWEWTDKKGRIKTGRLKKFFGGWKAVNVTSEILDRYVNQCLEEGLSEGTINRDLSALRTAFKLGLKKKRLQTVPYFPCLEEAAPRTGFTEESDFRKLVENTSALWLRAIVTTAYSFAFRRGELMNLRVAQIDLLHREIRLNAGETKNKQGRTIKMTGEVHALLSLLIEGRGKTDFVFTRADGQKIREFRDDWQRLCVASGLGKMMCPKCSSVETPVELPADRVCPRCSKKQIHPRYEGLLFHDLRRSGVRNMVRRGISERVAMQISGHKTREVFDRYDIVSERDLADAARKIELGQRAELGHTSVIPEENPSSEEPILKPVKPQ